MNGYLQPETTVERPAGPTTPDTSRYLRSYLIMRAMVGALGIALPFLLVLGDGVVFDGEPFPRGSLSSYYYSSAREVFVGTLCATAVFLITYKVVTRSLDNTLSWVAGMAVLLVAIFPTGRPSRNLALTPIQDRLGESVVQAIHFSAAFVFIAALAVICCFFGVREGKRDARPNKRSPQFWRNFHWTCSGVIAGSLAFVGIAALAGGPEKALLIGEALSVWAFGVSWLMKGLELDYLRTTERVPPAAATAEQASAA
jgi:hypothetical protein